MNAGIYKDISFFSSSHPHGLAYNILHQRPIDMKNSVMFRIYQRTCVSGRLTLADRVKGTIKTAKNGGQVTFVATVLPSYRNVPCRKRSPAIKNPRKSPPRDLWVEAVMKMFGTTRRKRNTKTNVFLCCIMLRLIDKAFDTVDKITCAQLKSIGLTIFILPAG
jgi:hypothetical protein